MKSYFNKIHFTDIGSTNAYAIENIKTLSHNTVITADIQTKGRGRFNRLWTSDSEKNLYVSIVIKPDVPYKRLPIVNFPQFFSVVIAEAFAFYGAAPQIKWPNDVLINSKKCAGILGETVFDGHVLNGLVVGMGVNIGDDPSERLAIKQPATSLAAELSRDVDKNEFLAKMLEIYALLFESFCINGFASIRDAYLKYFAYMGKDVSLVNNNQNLTGKVAGLSETGNLLLAAPSGEIKNIVIGEIL